MKEKIYRAVLTLAFTLSWLSLHAGMASAESLRFTGSPHFLPAPLMVVGVYTPEGQANFAPFHRGGVLASGKDGGPMRIGFGINQRISFSIDKCVSFSKYKRVGFSKHISF